MERINSRSGAALLLALVGAAMGASCVTTPFEARYDPRPSGQPAADVAAEIGALAQSLEERAGLRTTLGTARVIVEDLEVLQPREARYRYAALDEREHEAMRTTVRRELEMALGNRINVVDTAALAGSAETAQDLRRRAGATHAVTGTLLREGSDVEVALKLVDLRDGWIVATAQRRIERFVSRDLVPVRGGNGVRLSAEVEAAPRVDDAALDPQQAAAVDSPADEAVDVIEEAETADLDDGVPSDAVIEFEAGPAASRLEQLLGNGPPK